MDDLDLTRRASVVVCARDRADLIGTTLEAVVAQRPLEIIVIDDCSVDETAAVARRYTERVEPSGGHGLAAARQFGADLARGEFVVYVDSDAVLGERCLAALVEALDGDPSAAAAMPRHEQIGPGSYWSRSAEVVRQLRRLPAPYTDRCPCTTVAIRRDVLLDVRFDPFFTGAGEDLDFAIRLREAGWKIRRCPDVAVGHHARDGAVGLIRQQIWYGRGAARVAWKRRGEVNLKDVPGHPQGWRSRVVSGRHFAIVPYLLVSGAAHRLGFALEQRRLRRL